ncbi:ABC transporter permease [Methanohalophilus halophilus]|uniref:ABC transporter permease n=1 Tax=Methanohalophilus halophilus TaxID=2177 RepID=A0A1L3Q2B0_9EURY|nr:ABC transporter permease [Methanohalophilus halophilus]APH38931.1 ABC transporter permease [Methanohalophilus halophilus]RNI07443.1 FtsX-like permease family protein [Methanohalophilus halophilus]SDW66217.1 putative ABC transport system permease protein [Methanohalophilus halophilus]
MVGLSEAIKLAFASIGSAKLRSALTTLGIIIGVAAVIANISLGASFGQYFEEEIGASGTNFIVIFTQKNNVFGDSQFNVVENTNGVAAVSPINQQSATLRYQSAERTATVSGVLPDYGEVGNINMEHGQFLTSQDGNVAVIGSDVAYDKFDRNLSVKNFIKISIRNVDGGISTRTFRVKGIIQDPDASFVSPEVDPAGRVFIPLAVMQEMQHRDDIGGFFIKADSLEILDRVTDDVDENLARSVGVPSRDIDNEDAKPYEIFNQQDILDQINQLSSALTSILVAVALISLIVGSIGIMNIMLVTVTERTKEIGLMKALGYNYFDILTIFIVESVIISLFGGILGLLLGLVASMAVNNYLDIANIFPISLILLGFGISFVVGLVSGVYPANKAAKMDPVEALHYE